MVRAPTLVWRRSLARRPEAVRVACESLGVRVGSCACALPYRRSATSQCARSRACAFGGACARRGAWSSPDRPSAERRRQLRYCHTRRVTVLHTRYHVMRADCRGLAVWLKLRWRCSVPPGTSDGLPPCVPDSSQRRVSDQTLHHVCSCSSLRSAPRRFHWPPASPSTRPRTGSALPRTTRRTASGLSTSTGPPGARSSGRWTGRRRCATGRA